MNFKSVSVTWEKSISFSLNRVFSFRDFQSFSVMKNIDIPVKEKALTSTVEFNSSSFSEVPNWLSFAWICTKWYTQSCFYLLLMNFGYLKYAHTLGIVASGRGDLLSDKNSCATSVDKRKRVLNLFSDLNVNFFLIFSDAYNFIWELCHWAFILCVTKQAGSQYFTGHAKPPSRNQNWQI